MAATDKEWSRRQCSIVWAPMPAEFRFDVVTKINAKPSGHRHKVYNHWLLD
jgi:hypothetical protein